ncbi:hypothetical protein Bca52824_002781 [Brassica carinata]|uniref:F-box associated beta-propeller type 3 domain-containing protein n=1 Tax=Brassica carinata TaxID=52824 RepID=A0A8X7WKX3_BRACI|nr:hypothetical protein Bca52824_002781 [Brassica carinata]
MKVKKKKLELGGDRRCSSALLKPYTDAYAFQQIPDDVVCASKLWSFLISSRYFTNVYLTRRPRRLFTYIFLLSSPHPDSARPVYVLDKDLNMPAMADYFVGALRGLLCVRIGRKVRICNLTTKQLVELELPIRKRYKVLNIFWELSNDRERVVRFEYQVLVLRPQALWRNTKSSVIPPPHRPCSLGISINGVLYYRAQFDKNDTYVFMSFDLTSEEFTLIKLPLDVVSCPYLMNYGGKVAVFEYSQSLLATNGSVDLWALDNGGCRENYLVKKFFVLPVSQMNFFSCSHLWMKGTSRSGEVWLGKTILDRGKHILFVSYDMERNKIIPRVEIICGFVEKHDFPDSSEKRDLQI